LILTPSPIFSVLAALVTNDAGVATLLLELVFGAWIETFDDLPFGTILMQTVGSDPNLPGPHPAKIPVTVPLTGFGGTLRRTPGGHFEPAQAPSSFSTFRKSPVIATAVRQSRSPILSREDRSRMMFLTVQFSFDADIPCTQGSPHH